MGTSLGFNSLRVYGSLHGHAYECLCGYKFPILFLPVVPSFLSIGFEL